MHLDRGPADAADPQPPTVPPPASPQPVLPDVPTPEADAGAGATAGVDTQDGADPLTGRLDRIEAALAATTRALDSAADRAAARERVIDRQHAEIERLRSVERVGTMRPVITDLCRLRSDLLRQAVTIPETTTAAQVVELMESFADSVVEALERCGVEPITAEPGEPFVPQRHRAAATTSTDDPDRDGTVAAVLADGYAETDGGKVVAAVRVAVHTFTTSQPTEIPTDEERTA